jgi:hypothetical protein
MNTTMNNTMNNNWQVFVNKFYDAFIEGHISTLDELKNTQNDFRNINDLGGYFMRYGSGMDKWNDLINDSIKYTPSPRTWEVFSQQFLYAFNNGHVHIMENLKSTQNGFRNINDLSGDFMKYGSGMEKWNDLISDSMKNVS